MHLPGRELFWDTKLNFFARIYSYILGVPILGLRIRLRRVKKLWPKTASYILDAGCGRGVITRELARRFPLSQITAMDLNKQGQECNKKLSSKVYLNNINWINADVTLYKNANAFDFIISVDNLEHVEEDEKVLENFYTSMKKDGVLVVHVPHYYRRWPIFKWIENFDVPEHVRPGYHLPEIKERIQRAGFCIQETGFSYGFLENLMNNLSYKITEAREKRMILYAILFPFMNTIAWFGQWSKPNFGAGVWVIARK